MTDRRAGRPNVLSQYDRRYFHDQSTPYPPGFPLPTPTDAEAVKATLRGIRRTIGGGKVKKATALAERGEVMVQGCPDTLAGKRDRAVLLLGFAGAFRRSQLVALYVEHIEETANGLRVLIASSKTDFVLIGATPVVQGIPPI